MVTKKNTPTKCYITSYENPTLDPFLMANGFGKGIIMFAVPSQGILFRCRVTGTGINLEFAALFALLRFLESSVGDRRPASIRVFSSNPEFIFSFSGKGRHLSPGSSREKQLRKFSELMKIAVGYVELADNYCLTSTADYPSLPDNARPYITPERSSKETDFGPFQKGLIF